MSLEYNYLTKILFILKNIHIICPSDPDPKNVTEKNLFQDFVMY